MVGEEGLEPSNGGSKGRCLTIWRLPSRGRYLTRITRKGLSDDLTPGSRHPLAAACFARDPSGREHLTEGIHPLGSPLQMLERVAREGRVRLQIGEGEGG